MKTRTVTPVNLVLTMLLGLVLAIPAAVEAGRGHHRFGHTHHHHHYYNHGHGHSHKHHRHYKKRHYKRHHYNRHNPYYGGGYNRIYSPPQQYYNRPYYNRPYYNTRPGYNYGSNVISYPPAAGYAYPPQVMLGVNTGNASFMLRY
ncbi:hypothetical protein [Nitrosomonas marina]|uniref:Uncharacterized protein n=1 Tax=Nitrosomonas marina TaxID=917 RepID=A0A1H8CQP4_9PROT|nr:hypothetical protein [Nitrosomonas marina]SEM96754.1 hypothetical protein SAMN05216325_10567 [Nitrosomonas marina]